MTWAPEIRDRAGATRAHVDFPPLRRLIADGRPAREPRSQAPWDPAQVAHDPRMLGCESPAAHPAA
jgi:hypothetical protein